MKIQVYADASLGSLEKDSETKSVMGYIILLSNPNNEVNTIHWKSKTIERVAQDTKSAETLALESAVDDAQYLSNMLSEIYNGSTETSKFHLL